MKTEVRYAYGWNNMGTRQHEVLEYGIIRTPSRLSRATGNLDPAHFDVTEEGPYVLLYTESQWAAEAIAAILTADGGDNNYPLMPTADNPVVVTEHKHDGIMHTHEPAPRQQGPWGPPGTLLPSPSEES